MTFHFGILSQVDSEVASIAFVCTIFFIIFFDQVTNLIEQKVQENVIYNQMLQKIYKELMMMGFVSLLVMLFQSSKAADQTQSVIDAVDYVGYMLFFVAIFFVAHAFYIMVISMLTSRRYAQLHATNLADALEIFSGVSKSSWKSLLFHCRYLPLSRERSQVEFKVIYALFRDTYWLPPDFDYGSYLGGCLAHYSLNLINIEHSSWGIMIFLCGVNYARMHLFDTDSLWSCAGFKYDEDHRPGDSTDQSAQDISQRCARRHLQLFFVCAVIMTAYVLLLYPIGKFYESRLMARAGVTETKDIEEFLAFEEKVHLKVDMQRMVEIKLPQRKNKSNRMRRSMVLGSVRTRASVREAPSPKKKKLMQTQTRNEYGIGQLVIKGFRKVSHIGRPSISPMTQEEAVSTDSREAQKAKFIFVESSDSVDFTGDRNSISLRRTDQPVSATTNPLESKEHCAEIADMIKKSARPAVVVKPALNQHVCHSIEEIEELTATEETKNSSAAASEPTGVRQSIPTRQRRKSVAMQMKEALQHSPVTEQAGLDREGAVGEGAVIGQRRKSLVQGPSRERRRASIVLAGGPLADGRKLRQSPSGVDKLGADQSINSHIEGFKNMKRRRGFTMKATNAKSIMNLIVQKHKTNNPKSRGASRGASFKAKQPGSAPSSFLDEVDESLKMREDFSDIFIMNSPELFFRSVEIAIMLNSLYLSIWVTNYITVVDHYTDNNVLWQFVMLIPLFVVVPCIGEIVKTASLLTAVAELNVEVIGEIIEVEEESKLLSDEFRKKILRRIKGAKADQQEAIELLFEEIDIDNSGYINRKEFRDMLTALHLHYSVQKFQRLFNLVDMNRSGSICIEELFRVIFPELANKQELERRALIVNSRKKSHHQGSNSGDKDDVKSFDEEDENDEKHNNSSDNSESCSEGE